jgi:hypothetical protein
MRAVAAGPATRLRSNQRYGAPLTRVPSTNQPTMAVPPAGTAWVRKTVNEPPAAEGTAARTETPARFRCMVARTILSLVTGAAWVACAAPAGTVNRPAERGNAAPPSTYRAGPSPPENAWRPTLSLSRVWSVVATYAPVLRTPLAVARTPDPSVPLDSISTVPPNARSDWARTAPPAVILTRSVPPLKVSTRIRRPSLGSGVRTSMKPAGICPFTSPPNSRKPVWPWSVFPPRYRFPSLPKEASGNSIFGMLSSSPFPLGQQVSGWSCWEARGRHSSATKPASLLSGAPTCTCTPPVLTSPGARATQSSREVVDGLDLASDGDRDGPVRHARRSCMRAQQAGGTPNSRVLTASARQEDRLHASTKNSFGEKQRSSRGRWRRRLALTPFRPA